MILGHSFEHWMGDLLHLRFEITLFWPCGGNDAHDAVGGILGKSAKETCFSSRLIFVDIDFHKNRSFDVATIGLGAVFLEAKVALQRRKVLGPAVGKFLRVEKVLVCINHDDFKCDVGWVKARSR